jgi:hypothetical protein
MNEEASGCYGCNQDKYTPSDFTQKTYGPVDDLTSFWNSLDGMSKGLLISGVLLSLVFLASKLR